MPNTSVTPCATSVSTKASDGVIFRVLSNLCAWPR